jgi:transcriptional regulator with XRE-family HTH domain
MDTEWFAQRMQILGIVQEDVARALILDRSTVSRIQSGQRPLTLAEVEPLAAILQVPALEVIEHAHDWRTPIRYQVELRPDLLVIALSVAIKSLADGPILPSADIAQRAAAVYSMLVESEAKGRPIADDERALELVENTLRRMRAIPERRGGPR